MERSRIIERVESEADRVRSFGVDRLFLVGSYAKGEEDENSDVDFLVEFREGRGFFEDYTGLKRLLEEVTGRKVDLIKKELVRPELKESIIKGVKVEAKV